LRGQSFCRLSVGDISKSFNGYVIFGEGMHRKPRRPNVLRNWTIEELGIGQEEFLRERLARDRVPTEFRDLEAWVTF